MTTRTPRRARAGLALAGIGLLLATLTACTPGPAETPELVAGDSDAAYDEWAIDFGACMKAEGIDLEMSAATSGSSGDDASTQSLDVGEVDLEAMDAANEKCIDEVGEPPVQPGMPDAEEMNEAMLAFAACMREAGYDYPDPEISTDGGIVAMEAMSADEMDPADVDACNEQAGFPDMSESDQ
ncbi:hypothetical protein [Agromyces sp. Marseille-Q5079]|uniref:hypothetical protein n=1 Tax=Agromyces sp. Marseille-Q5079 TaxID=3439059 RepID=UPI003D9CB3B7